MSTNIWGWLHSLTKKSVYQRVYEQAVMGVPAKKICLVVKRDKARVSRILGALVDCGFLVLVNPGDRVRFYAATKKKYSPDADVILSTNLKGKSPRSDYGGYYSRCHGISFKASVKTWGKGIKWDKEWQTRGASHYCYRYPFARLGSVCFTRIVGRECDTLRVDIPPIRWNVARGSPEEYLYRVARKVVGWFCSQYDVSVSDLVKCDGDKHGLVVRDAELVKVAQERTIVWSNGVELDASHGVPEFEGPWDVMSELLALPRRVEALERAVAGLSQSIPVLQKSIEDLTRALSVPRGAVETEGREVSWG